jgi:hypothetical protein
MQVCGSQKRKSVACLVANCEWALMALENLMLETCLKPNCAALNNGFPLPAGKSTLRYT